MDAKFWQICTSAVVLLSFIAANLGWEPAQRVWFEAPDSIAILLGLGVGLKMAKDVGMSRYRNDKGSQNVDPGA